MNDFQAELDRIVRAYPCRAAALARPRLVMLPPWWPVQLGAWAYFNFVLIAPGVAAAPAAVRSYVLGHEYGHIHSGHTLLHFAYWICAAGAIVAMLMPAPVLGLVSMLGLSAVVFAAIQPSAAIARELQADTVAVQIYGRESVLDGALWMAKHSGSITGRMRRRRLEALGWVRKR